MYNIVIDMEKKKKNNLSGIQSLVVLKGKKKKNKRTLHPGPLLTTAGPGANRESGPIYHMSKYLRVFSQA